MSNFARRERGIVFAFRLAAAHADTGALGTAHAAGRGTSLMETEDQHHVQTIPGTAPAPALAESVMMLTPTPAIHNAR